MESLEKWPKNVNSAACFMEFLANVHYMRYMRYMRFFL